jgi:hypothetical protein
VAAGDPKVDEPRPSLVRIGLHVANDTWITPQALILWHERRRWRFKVEAAQDATIAGERVEAVAFQ